MKLSEIKQVLQNVSSISFQVPNGTFVPSHFHVTEVGKVVKNFIDCGGTVRNEAVANFQLWEADDYDHRLHPEKLLHIIELSEQKLHIEDLEIEVEYQMASTIGKFDLAFDGKSFQLVSKLTACLAEDQCGIPPKKQKVSLADIQNTSSCTPGGGCC